jgi:hypothetical protein
MIDINNGTKLRFLTLYRSTQKGGIAAEGTIFHPFGW